MSNMALVVFAALPLFSSAASQTHGAETHPCAPHQIWDSHHHKCVCGWGDDGKMWDSVEQKCGFKDGSSSKVLHCPEGEMLDIYTSKCVGITVDTCASMGMEFNNSDGLAGKKNPTCVVCSFHHLGWDEASKKCKPCADIPGMKLHETASFESWPAALPEHRWDGSFLGISGSKYGHCASASFDVDLNPTKNPPSLHKRVFFVPFDLRFDETPLKAGQSFAQDFSSTQFLQRNHHELEKAFKAGLQFWKPSEANTTVVRVKEVSLSQKILSFTNGLHLAKSNRGKSYSVVIGFEVAMHAGQTFSFSQAFMKQLTHAFGDEMFRDLKYPTEALVSGLLLMDSHSIRATRMTGDQEVAELAFWQAAEQCDSKTISEKIVKPLQAAHKRLRKADAKRQRVATEMENAKSKKAQKKLRKVMKKVTHRYLGAATKARQVDNDAARYLATHSEATENVDLLYYLQANKKISDFHQQAHNDGHHLRELEDLDESEDQDELESAELASDDEEEKPNSTGFMAKRF